MNIISPNLPLWNREFSNFETCLAITEKTLYGEKQTKSFEVRHLWEQLMESSSIFMGETNAGPLYLCVCHLPSGTTYFLDLKTDQA